MRVLKKINKGLVLTIIVVLALTIYLVNVEKGRKADKEIINNVCEEFIDITDKYAVLPENIRNIMKNTSLQEIQNGLNGIAKEEKEQYLKEMKTELEKIMIDNQEVINMQYESLENELEASYNIQSVRTKIERNITKIKSYEFDGNQVTVTFNSKLKISTVNLTANSEEKENQEKIDITDDTIILQKVDGKWKVTYSLLQYNTFGVFYGI